MKTQSVSLLPEEYRIWQKYSSYIFWLCMRKCKNFDVTQDFFQEIYIKFHLHAQKVANHPCPGYWFKFVIDNEWRSVKRKQRRQVRTVPYECHENEEVYVVDEDPVTIMDDIENALVLDPLEKMLLEYSYIGFSYAELSDILGFSAKTLRKKARLALQRLMSSGKTEDK